MGGRTKIWFLLVLAMLALVACGEDTETVRVMDRYTLDMLGKGVSLTEEKCDSVRIGQLLYVGDSSGIYYCTGKAWKKINGKDGKDGRDGKDGENGAPGKKGKYGTSGTDCFIDEFTEGFVLGCGATKAVIRYDFELPDTCRIALRSDSSYVLTCGSDSTMLSQGPQGVAGDICKQADIGEGRVRLVCGSDSVTLFRAACGDTPFDPDGLMFCYGDTLVERCNTHAYDIKQQFCYLKYDPITERCYEGVVVPKCPTELNDNQFCDERNGKVYRFTVIGEMTWMAQNLDYRVPNSFCQKILRDDSLYCEDEKSEYIYWSDGRYYPWSIAMARTEDECGYGHKCPNLTYPHQGVCPEGWHLPDTTEWRALIKIMGKDNRVYWDRSIKGSDEYGLSVIPTGIVAVEYADGVFSRRSENVVNPASADIWSSSEDRNSSGAILYFLYVNGSYSGIVNELAFSKSEYARTVRCVKD